MTACALSDCQCRECTNRRAFVARIDEIKEELWRTSPGFGEFDWGDLERSCREEKSKRDAVRLLAREVDSL